MASTQQGSGLRVGRPRLLASLVGLLVLACGPARGVPVGVAHAPSRMSAPQSASEFPLRPLCAGAQAVFDAPAAVCDRHVAECAARAGPAVTEHLWLAFLTHPLTVTSPKKQRERV